LRVYAAAAAEAAAAEEALGSRNRSLVEAEVVVVVVGVGVGVGIGVDHIGARFESVVGVGIAEMVVGIVGDSDMGSFAVSDTPAGERVQG
jgi:hypothetical protein